MQNVLPMVFVYSNASLMQFTQKVLFGKLHAKSRFITNAGFYRALLHHVKPLNLILILGDLSVFLSYTVVRKGDCIRVQHGKHVFCPLENLHEATKKRQSYMNRGVAKYLENDSRIFVRLYSCINSLENDTVISLSSICSATF